MQPYRAALLSLLLALVIQAGCGGEETSRDGVSGASLTIRADPHTFTQAERDFVDCVEAKGIEVAVRPSPRRRRGSRPLVQFWLLKSERGARPDLNEKLARRTVRECDEQ